MLKKWKDNKNYSKMKHLKSMSFKINQNKNPKKKRFNFSKIKTQRLIKLS